jgi:alanine racemase
LGYRKVCVADVSEAAALAESGLGLATVILSPPLPEHAAALVTLGCEPVICTEDMANALNAAADKAGRRVPVHIAVDTGMGRVGMRPADTPAFFAACEALPGLAVVGIMSHFASADEADKTVAEAQLGRFQALTAAIGRRPGLQYHMANSAGMLELPGAAFDAVRPGIAMYGLPPSADIANPAAAALRPALEWTTPIVYLKEVPAGTGLSYGHDYHTPAPALIATVPVGYGDGLHRNLSGRMEMIVQGVRCPQVGRITMDLSLLDVTALRGLVHLGDEAVIIGQRGGAAQCADDLAATLGTINYEIVTAITQRVTRRIAT